MDIDYLYSIIDLYLDNEKDNHRTNMVIEKQDNNVCFSFNMDENDFEKTILNLSIEDFSKEINNVLNYYKQEIIIIHEEYANNQENPSYKVFLQNGRTISMNGFSVLEINNMRNTLYNIRIDSDEIRLEALNEKKPIAYKPPFGLQQTGFASHTTLFLIALYLTDIFLIALLIFKLLGK